MTEVAWLDGDRFRPAEGERSRNERDDEQQSPDRVEVRQWVEREPAVLAGRRIAEHRGRDAVRELVQRQAAEEHGQEQQ